MPDIVRISLTDMSSLERMSEKNKRSYIERFGNVLMRNSEIKKSLKTHHDTASMLNNRWNNIILYYFVEKYFIN